MCVKKTEAWEHGGKLYPSEIEAIDAALADVGQKLVKDHSTNMQKGLIALSESLVSLLTRRRDLERGDVAS